MGFMPHLSVFLLLSFHCKLPSIFVSRVVLIPWFHFFRLWMFLTRYQNSFPEQQAYDSPQRLCLLYNELVTELQRNYEAYFSSFTESPLYEHIAIVPNPKLKGDEGKQASTLTSGNFMKV